MGNITAHTGNTAILTTLITLPGDHIVDEKSSNVLSVVMFEGNQPKTSVETIVLKFSMTAT
jgi:hypothetical protein